MALLIDTLSTNKSIFNPNSEESGSKYGIWDLTKSSITFEGVNSQLKSFVVVSEYFQMRPDLISILNLGDQRKVGSLLKYNGISNPFAIKEGDLLLIPTSETVQEMFTAKKIKEQSLPNSNTNKNPNQVFKNNQEQKKFKVSEGRKKFLDEKVKNKPEMILPPNVSQPNEVPVIKKDGFFIFAPNAGGGGTNVPVD
jgi:hypothetical protein